MKKFISKLLILLLILIILNYNIILLNSEIEIVGFEFSNLNSTGIYLLRIWNNSGIYDYYLKIGERIQENSSLIIITGLTQIKIITNISNIIGVLLKYENTTFLLWSGFLENGGNLTINAPLLPNSTLGIITILGYTTSIIYFPNIYPYSYYDNFFILNTYKLEIINIVKSEIKFNINFTNPNETYIKPILIQKLGFLIEYNNNYTLLRAYGINSTLIYSFTYASKNSSIAYYNFSLYNGKFSEVKKIININNIPVIITDLGFIYVPNEEIMQYQGNLIILKNGIPVYFISKDGQIYQILNISGYNYYTFLFKNNLISLLFYNPNYPSILEVPKRLFMNVSPLTLILTRDDNILIFMEPNTTYYITINGLPFFKFSINDLIIPITSTLTFIALVFITKNKLNPNRKD